MHLCLNKALFLPGYAYEHRTWKGHVWVRWCWAHAPPWLASFFFFIQPGIIFGTEDLFLVGMESEAIVILKWRHQWLSEKAACPGFGLSWKSPSLVVLIASSLDQKTQISDTNLYQITLFCTHWQDKLWSRSTTCVYFFSLRVYKRWCSGSIWWLWKPELGLKSKMTLGDVPLLLSDRVHDNGKESVHLFFLFRQQSELCSPWAQRQVDLSEGGKPPSWWFLSPSGSDHVSVSRVRPEESWLLAEPLRRGSQSWKRTDLFILALVMSKWW